MQLLDEFVVVQAAYAFGFNVQFTFRLWFWLVLLSFLRKKQWKQGGEFQSLKKVLVDFLLHWMLLQLPEIWTSPWKHNIWLQEQHHEGISFQTAIWLVIHFLLFPFFFSFTSFNSFIFTLQHFDCSKIVIYFAWNHMVWYPPIFCSSYNFPHLFTLWSFGYRIFSCFVSIFVLWSLTGLLSIYLFARSTVFICEDHWSWFSLFLFNFSSQKMHVIFQAVSFGQMNINLYGRTTDDLERTLNPAFLLRFYMNISLLVLFILICMIVYFS